MSEMWKVTFTAPIPTVATVAAGVVLCHDTDGNTFVKCLPTATNAKTPKVITTASGTSGAGVAVQATGFITSTISGLSSGTAGPVIVSSTATLQRFSGILTATSPIVGWADATGNVILAFDGKIQAGDTITAATMANGANTNFALHANDNILYVTGPTGAYNLTGMTGGYDGRSVLIINATAQILTLKNDATSTAANRLYCYGHLDSTVGAYEAVRFTYSATVSRWIQTTGVGSSEIVPGNLVVDGTLEVVGATTLDSTLNVTGLTTATGGIVNGANTTFAIGVASPTITQTTQALSATPNNLFINPQAPNASADNSTHGTAGSLVTNMAAGVNGGKSGWFTVQNAGVNLARIGSFDGTSTSYGVIHLHTSTPSGSNYTLASSNDGSGVYLNSGSTVNIAVANTNYITVSSAAVTLIPALTTVQGNINLGYFTQAMADAPQTINAANSQKNIIITTGVNSGVRALTISTAPNAGIIKFIRNNCTVFGITVQFSTGAATGTIAPGTSAIVIADGTDAVVLMTGT